MLGEILFSARWIMPPIWFSPAHNRRGSRQLLVVSYYRAALNSLRAQALGDACRPGGPNPAPREVSVRTHLKRLMFAAVSGAAVSVNASDGRRITSTMSARTESTHAGRFASKGRRAATDPGQRAQGYLAHKKTPSLPGPSQGPRHSPTVGSYE